jgi:hypothetical protein
MREDILDALYDVIDNAYYNNFPTDITRAMEHLYDAIYEGRKERVADLYNQDWELMEDLMKDFLPKDLADAIILWQGRF